MSFKTSLRRRGEQNAANSTVDKPQTIQQQRAAFCFERVQKVVALKKDDVSKVFKAKASSLPAMVQMNGLGQALAFAKSKSDDRKPDDRKSEGIAWQHLYNLVSDWHARDAGCYSGEDVLSGIMTGDMHVYRQAQAETQALLVWVRKFARAEIRGEVE